MDDENLDAPDPLNHPAKFSRIAEAADHLSAFDPIGVPDGRTLASAPQDMAIGLAQLHSIFEANVALPSPGTPVPDTGNVDPSCLLSPPTAVHPSLG